MQGSYSQTATERTFFFNALVCSRHFPVCCTYGIFKALDGTEDDFLSPVDSEKEVSSYSESD